MKENISSQVANFLQDKLLDFGYEIYEVTYQKAQNGMNLTVYITKNADKITIQDCEKVHRFIDPLLDELNPTKDAPYYLNVSSVGLDKPLTSPKDYKRCLGEEVCVKLYTQLNGKKEFTGKLLNFDEENLTVSDAVIPIKSVASCKLVIKF